ncbi:MAG TPA: hypothetical protein PKE31_21300 [Pseudomonadota bacterium]|nr:hypothetical protein [Pseudomonadota bacterium]
MRSIYGSELAAQQAARQRVEARLSDAEMELQWLIDQTPACKVRRYGQLLKESCQNNRCEPESFKEALQGLSNLRDSYVVIYLRPGPGADGISGERLDEVSHMLLDRARRPTTRLLVVALPHGETQADWQRADQVARDLLAKIQIKLTYSRDFHPLGPTAIGCSRDMRNLFAQFAAKKPPRLPKEPKLSEAITAVVFRLDCY